MTFLDPEKRMFNVVIVNDWPIMKANVRIVESELTIIQHEFELDYKQRLTKYTIFRETCPTNEKQVIMIDYYQGEIKDFPEHNPVCTWFKRGLGGIPYVNLVKLNNNTE